MKELLFVKKGLIILFSLSLIQSLLSVAIAHQQTIFFDSLSVNLMTIATLSAYIFVLVSRSLLQFIKKSVHGFYCIAYHQEWLLVWRHVFKGTSGAQRSQLITFDLKQWLDFLLNQSSLAIEDFFQLLLFSPLIFKGFNTFGNGAIVPLFFYVIFLNILTYFIQKKAIALEQRKERLEAYWHARLYRKAILSDSSLQRYQKMILTIYLTKRLITFFDILQQVTLLLLPLVILYKPMLAGKIKIQDYVLFSQVIYNWIPAMTHLSVYRVSWAAGWASGTRLYEELSSSRAFSTQTSTKSMLVGG